MSYLEKGRKHIVVIFLLSSILFAVFSGVLYSQHKIAQYYSDDTLKSYETLRRIRLVYISLLNMETGKRGYLLIGDKKFLEPYNKAIITLDEQFKILEFTTLSTDQKQRLEAIKKRADIFEEALKKQIRFREQNPVAQLPVDDFYTNKRLMDLLRQDIDAFVEIERDNLFDHMQQLKNQQDNYLITLLLGTIFTIASLFIANAIIMGLISRGKKIQQDLLESEERFAAVMNGVNDGIYDYDYENNKTYFSPSYKKMLGYEDNEIPNTIEAAKELVHPDDIEQASVTLQEYIERKQPVYNSVFRMRHKNGSWVWVLSRGVGIWNKQGRILRVIGTHTDITAQKEREEELKQLNTDLEGFTYLASHDLRSPLVNLKGFAGEIKYVLKTAAPIIKKAKSKLSQEDSKEFETAFEHDIPEALEYISDAVVKMDKLTSSILDLSKIGRHEFKKVEVDTNESVNLCLKALNYEIQKNNIDIEIKKLPVIISDPMAIEQIFSNIIDNAIKYMASGRKGKIVIDSFNAGYYTIFAIQDNGRGIAEHDYKRVFDFFRRASNSSDVRGNGMGMAFVKATIRKLGGNIWFESRLGEGTCFYFSVPKQPAKEA